jgi:hypothetical protein
LILLIKKSLLTTIIISIVSIGLAQPITGVWKGTAGKYRVELKIIKKGDSLTGTAYYYASTNNYARFSIKGYFDPRTNAAIWWDDELIENKLGHHHDAILNVADFNCPGEDEMKLEGNSFLRDEKKKAEGPLNLEKKKSHVFADEWDWVIENYTLGANDPYIIDSIAHLDHRPIPYIAKNKPVAPKYNIKEEPVVSNNSFKQAIKETEKPILVKSLTPEEKFASRKKILEQVIPIKGDSIELRFYDNGEIDGDSIALFMNSKLVFKHVMITDQAYTVKFATKDLEEDNDAVMVAENLGSIPPNTSLMVAIVGDQRYEAHLFADENSSALIRFIKENKKRNSE